MQSVTTKQTAGILEVSETTVRNWVNHGLLSPVAGNNNRFDITAVELLKHEILTGKIDRLRKRANKKNTNNSFIPDEYLESNDCVVEINQIRAMFMAESLDLSTALFVLTIKQLALRHELTINFDRIFAADSYQNCLRKSLASEITAWLAELDLNNITSAEAYSSLFATLTDVSQEDTVGIIYQSLMIAGNKARKGSFYTPAVIIEDIFKDHAGREGLFLDPCCGTGQFLLRAARNGYSDPNQLFGIDVDKLAVRIARINLLLAFPDISFSPQIFHANFLLEKTGDRPFAMIATNPPWGADFCDDDLADLGKLYPHIKSRESFSYFLAKSLDLAAKNAVISFILPESFLNIRAHSDVRALILERSSIMAIHSIGRQFKSVYTPVIRLDLLNVAAPAGWPVCLRQPDNSENIVPQARFQSNLDHIFDAGLSEEENQIVAKLYSLPHLTLKNNAEWALGIVTGDNKKHVTATFEDGLEPVYKGSDVAPYHLKTTKSFIRFIPGSFQQVAPTARYRASEKLVYKFISNRLVFAYDDKQSLTINSANILIPGFADYPIKVVLCLLNSKLFHFVFAKKFNTHKVLRGDLEKLPLPLFSEEILRKLVALADRAILGEPVADKIDAVIFNALNFSSTEIDLILSGIALK